MLAFLIIALCACSVVLIINVVVLILEHDNELGGLGAINIAPLVLAIIAMSICLSRL